MTAQKIEKVKPPRPPLCLCNNVAEWAFGIVSQSKYFGYRGKTNRERDAIERYFAALEAYRAYEWAQRVAARSVTKEEWREHYRSQRITARELKAQKDFEENLQKIKAAAEQAATAITKALAEAMEKINAK